MQSSNSNLARLGCKGLGREKVAEDSTRGSEKPCAHVHRTSRSLFYLVQITPSVNCAILPVFPSRSGKLEAQRCEEIAWCQKGPGCMALWHPFHRDVLGLNSMMGDENTEGGAKGAGAGTWNSSSCRDEAWVRSGQGCSEVESWPGSHLSG